VSVLISRDENTGSGGGFDPTHGQHFLQSVAGNDLRLAFLITCVPALVIAGLVGIFGARWMKDDIAPPQGAGKLTPLLTTPVRLVSLPAPWEVGVAWLDAKI